MIKSVTQPQGSIIFFIMLQCVINLFSISETVASDDNEVSDDKDAPKNVYVLFYLVIIILTSWLSFSASPDSTLVDLLESACQPPYLCR